MNFAVDYTLNIVSKFHFSL